MDQTDITRSICATKKRIYVWSLRAFATVLSACGLAIPASQAAPIIFQFEATVTEVPADAAALNLPFSFAVGQKINGSYSFASGDDLLDIFLHPELGKEGSVSLNFGDTEAVAPTNTGIVSDGALSVPSIVEGPSSLYLSYFSPNNVVPPWDGIVSGQRWNTVLILTGLSGAVSDSNQFLDVNTWNRFLVSRQLILQFYYVESHQIHYVTFPTTVGEFGVAPEPSTACTLRILSAIGLTYFLIKRAYRPRTQF